EHFADRGEAQLDVELVRNHLGDDLARPQTKIKPILTRVFAVDPTKDLPQLRFRQLRRTARCFTRTQSVKTAPFPFCRPQPFINRCAAKAVGFHYFAGILPLPHALYGHSPDLFQGFVIESSSISFHAESMK